MSQDGPCLIKNNQIPLTEEILSVIIRIIKNDSYSLSVHAGKKPTGAKEGIAMSFSGLIIGVAAFLIIGVFHPIVIKCEYYFTDGVWPIFLVIGIAAVAASCFVRQIMASAILAIFGCTCLWSIIELKEQRERVKKGWFPANPARAGHRPDESDGEYSK